MPRSKRDNLKRYMAQALNNSAKAILDINSVYEEFKGVHKEHELQLGIIMLEIQKQREKMLVFIYASWGLNEDTIKSYLP